MRTSLLLLTLLLALCLCPGGVACAEEQIAAFAPGDRLPDFSVETVGGETVTLDGLLSEYDMVLINFFATWCDPCAAEFPLLEQAYESHKDSVAVLALSTDPEDTAELLREYADQFGMSFHVGQDTSGLYDAFRCEGIPTSVVVDRFGTVCFIETGALPDAELFVRLFDAFLGEDYLESTLYYAIPEAKTAIQDGANPTEAVFSVRYVDQNGNPVPGAVLQVCNDTSCMLFTSDENGLCAFTLEPYPWELHTLMVPRGYTGDTQTVTVSSLRGGEYVFELSKN